MSVLLGPRTPAQLDELLVRTERAPGTGVAVAFLLGAPFIADAVNAPDHVGWFRLAAAIPFTVGGFGLREAAYALGTPKWKVILSVTLRSARSGVVTGVLLALARISGETAPLLRLQRDAQADFEAAPAKADALLKTTLRIAEVERRLPPPAAARVCRTSCVRSEPSHAGRSRARRGRSTCS